MNDTIDFKEKLTNFYRYPSICLFQDGIKKDTQAEYMSFLDKPRIKTDRQQMVYIHIPFCSYLCNYCPFYKVPERSHTAMIEPFVKALVKEIEMYAERGFFKGVKITNINWGGGTPMLLGTEHIITILDALYKNLDCSEVGVVSIEGDAFSLQDKDKLKALKAHGVTRTSMGIQTFNERLRKKLGVLPDVTDVYKSVKAIERADFGEWGCDILYNCPDQNVTEIRYNVDRIAELSPWVIDAYDLNISPNTKLQKMVDAGKFNTIPNNISEINMFQALMEGFEGHGYPQTRSVNWNNPEHMPHENGILNVFNSDLISFGPSGRTFLYSTGKNYRNHTNLEKYIEDINNGLFPLEAGNDVTQTQLEERDIMLVPYFLERKKTDINYSRFKEKIDIMAHNDYMYTTDDSVGITEKGKMWAGNIQYFFHSDDEMGRMAKSMFKSIQEKKNLFNQDLMNV
ncbi:MAG: radical SAM protein [Crocinitomix sp.]|nr:radical SAM protein [Crocinitomix sp.]